MNDVSVEAPERRPHALHQADRTWDQSNCSLDLWIELLHHLELEPLAAFGCAVRLDFEGDQYTFLRIPGPDLEALFGTGHRQQRHRLAGDGNDTRSQIRQVETRRGE